MQQLLHDVRDAWRQWSRTPVVTLIALASLALGIGATLAIFALVDAVLLRTLPVRDPHTLVRVVAEDTQSGRGQIDAAVSLPVWEHLRDTQPFAAEVAAFATDRVNLARGGEVRYVTGLYVSGGALDMLGVAPRLGRTITQADDREGAASVAMISGSLWQREYGAAPDVLGETVWVDHHPFTIIGVTPRGFYGLEVGRHVDVVLPVASRGAIAGPAWSIQRETLPWLTVYGRLAPGASLREASSTLLAWTPALRDATLPAGPAADRHLLNPLFLVSGAQGMSWIRRQYEQPMRVLLGAVALVLFIACANLAALVLARFTDRRHELGVRLALGATRGRLARALLIESVMLGAAGAMLGVWTAQWLVGSIVPYLTSPALRGVPPVIDVSVDARLGAVAAALAIASAVVAGLVPAWQAAGVAPQVSLAATSRTGLHGAQAARRMRVMVALQVALALVLASGAALLVRSFVGLTTAPTGAEPDRVLVATLSGELANEQPERRFDRLSEVTARLDAIPGVEAVSAGLVTPLSAAMAAGPLEVPGSRFEPPMPTPAGAMSPFNRVLPGFFHAVGTPILRGREFDDRDGAGTPPVVVVNEAFVEQHYGDADPLGRIVRSAGVEFTIVGVAGNARQMGLREERPVPMVFGLVSQGGIASRIPSLRFVIRTTTPDAVRAPIVAAVREIDPRLNVEFRTMRDEAEASVNRERLLAWLGTLFSTLGLLIAVVGLYGTFTYVVVRRRAEFGVRMALGAARGDILRLVLRDATRVLVAGVVLGVAGALAAGRLVESLLFDVSTRDPWLLGAAVAAVTLAALGASLVPARRAARLDPAVALREE
jgi:putative ABC transport system permease protein